MNTLIEYGIQNEQSNMRAHVSPSASAMFVFPTASAIEIMQKYPKRYANQPGIDTPTALGHIVPVRAIPGLWALSLDKDIFVGFTETLSTSAKGDRAVDVVLMVLRHGGFPLPICAKFETSQEIQITGTDIYVTGKWRIEVKCDFWASMEKGSPLPRCTGNVYLQIAECNPNKAY